MELIVRFEKLTAKSEEEELKGIMDAIHEYVRPALRERTRIKKQAEEESKKLLEVLREQ